jgi:thiamine-monophosphate kinase
MMDLSDGLGVDLPRLARASKVGFKIDINLLPRSRGCNIDNAVSDGDDYELLFTISPRESERLQKSWSKKFPKLLLTRIGRLNSRFEIRDWRLVRGYVHFK